MQPYQVKFYAYAETEEEINELQRELNNFVRAQYNNNTLVTAKKLTDAIRKFGNNKFVTNYLKK